MTYEKIAKANEIAAEIKGLQTAIASLERAQGVVDRVTSVAAYEAGTHLFWLKSAYKDSECYYVQESINRHFQTFVSSVLADAREKLELSKTMLEKL